MLKERVKATGKKFLLITLIVLISAQFVSIIRVDAVPPIVGIGTTNQTAPYESNPTAGTSSVGLTVSNIGYAYDGDWDTACSIQYGSADGYVELSSFDAPSVTFPIGWVDLKVSYKVDVLISYDERYRIVYQVGSSPWQILQDWINSTAAKFDFRRKQAQRTWSNQPEPNDGTWTWTDIGNIKFRVETDRVTIDHVVKFNLCEVWLSIYPQPLPPVGMSIQPSFVNVSISDYFFIDVYIANIVALWGYQFTISYNTTILTAIEFHTYYPFNDPAPSKINDTAGYVDISYSVYIEQGDFSLTGNSTLARIYFQADAFGESDLHFEKVVLSDWGGNKIPVQKTDGTFDNRLGGVPKALFSWTPTEPSEGETVTFNATDSYDPSGGTITSYTWYFEEGQTATGITTTHTYNVAKNYPGTYRVILTVTDDDGLRDSEIQYIAVTKHDVAVVSFKVEGATTTSPLKVTTGTVVQLKPGITNIGFFNETFDMAFYYNSTAIDAATLTPSPTVSLNPGQLEPLTFNWNTAGMSPGFYVMNATAGPVLGETYTDDNNKTGDGYSSSILLQGRHDMAVLLVTASPTEVYPGDSVAINCTVKNKGDFTEEFNLNVFYEDVKSIKTFIDNKTDTLDAGLNKTITFAWDTTSVVPGTYRIYAQVPALRFGSGDINETITTDNEKYATESVKVGGHNILVSEIKFIPESTLFMIGETVQINVTVRNTGSENETSITVTVTGNGTLIGSTNIASLVAGSKTTVTINWDTSGLTLGKYRIVANASQVAGEVNIQDNTLTAPLVTVGYHDIAVTDVVVSPTVVELGQQITIIATVKNIGVFFEQNFSVTAYYDQTTIGIIKVRSLSAGASNSTLSFALNTAGMIRGIYDISVVAGPVINETSTGDNTRIFHFIAVGYHDIAITDVTASPIEVVVGGSVSIDVTVVNHGNFTETFDVTVKYGDTKIDTQTVSDLVVGSSTTISFIWNTAGVSLGDYVIKAEADVSGEAYSTDNIMVGDTVKVLGESNMFLYIAVGAAVIIVVAVFLVYFFKVRKKS